MFLASFSYGTVFSSMTIYYNQHLGATITGAFLATSSLATFVSGLLAGFWADKFGRKPVMTWGTTIQVIGSVIALLSNVPGHVNPWTTFLGFLLISFGFNFDVTAGSAMIIDDSMPENRKTVFMLNYWAQNLSVIIGAALGAWLFKPAFFLLLIILLVTILVTLMIVLFMLTETFTPLVRNDKEKESVFSSYKTVLADKTYVIFIIANVLTTMIIMQFDNFLPVHLSNSFRTVTIFGFQIYGQRMLTIYLILACVMVVTLMTTVNKWTHKWSHKKGFVLGSILMTMGMIFAFMTTTFSPIFVAGIIYTFGEIIYTPSVQSLGADLMNPEKIGAYNGLGAVRQPLASIIAAGLVSASPFIKATGVSIALLIAEICAILLCVLAVNRHQQERHNLKKSR
ncbi:MF superfamily multidrug transporter [Lactococcus fujiensis JCM 16395]|uniref:MF superfamily multidrug transporter n=1 Tax=Lactococcus fujiensis JCM 16395 TaxID=1291764 RepID=A0A2A5RKG6_9LACT|nr:MF superfamily multidrug transporter [Lactococcus fujiensis JCM 16395]